MTEEWKEVVKHREQVQGRSGRLFVLGAVAAAAFLAGTHYFTRPPAEAISGATADAEIIRLPTIEPPRVAESSRPTDREPPATSGQQTYVGVYECVVNGQRVVSDRPCGDDAEVRTLVVDQPDPAEAARQRQQTRAAQQRAVRSSNSTAYVAGGVASTLTARASNQATCESIEQQIAYIDAQMRQGYQSQEGEWYRDRLRALKEQRYDLRCQRGN